MRVPVLFGSLIGVPLLALAAESGIGVAGAEMRIAVTGPLSVSPMTAQYATFGEQLRRGAELAVRDVNESGGINGQKLTLVIADDAGCDPKMAVEVANELARQGIVFVDGHYCSSASIPASRVYHDKGVLMISPASTNPRLTDQGFANVFASAVATMCKVRLQLITSSTKSWQKGSLLFMIRAHTAKALPTSFGGD
jgi:branched-chain amino acid transport system substrate-binding protein